MSAIRARQEAYEKDRAGHFVDNKMDITHRPEIEEQVQQPAPSLELTPPQVVQTNNEAETRREAYRAEILARAQQSQELTRQQTFNEAASLSEQTQTAQVDASQLNDVEARREAYKAEIMARSQAQAYSEVTRSRDFNQTAAIAPAQTHDLNNAAVRDQLANQAAYDGNLRQEFTRTSGSSSIERTSPYLSSEAGDEREQGDEGRSM